MNNRNMEAIMKPLGDSALIVQFGEGIHQTIHQKVRRLSAMLEEDSFTGFIESVPAYNNLLIYYNPYVVHQSHRTNQSNCELPFSPYQKVCTYMNDLVQKIEEKTFFEARQITIPVLYGGEYGSDLTYVAAYHGLSVEEVINIHSENEYLVYMIGFAPGFPFLGGMNENIATPRKKTPRLAIAPGSVGIAGKQTGVYPLETPGGWQIIGRTPQRLFLPEISPPTLLQPGDKLRFAPISFEEYMNYEGVKS
ncbi:MAG TPA: 5-oxoprolinase subunit PxpB [Virgibacillus sp.]|nr:5-oxoprolinase subunit PxpB [Virgibacillus sp.]